MPSAFSQPPGKPVADDDASGVHELGDFEAVLERVRQAAPPSSRPTPVNQPPPEKLPPSTERPTPVVPFLKPKSSTPPLQPTEPFYAEASTAPGRAMMDTVPDSGWPSHVTDPAPASALARRAGAKLISVPPKQWPSERPTAVPFPAEAQPEPLISEPPETEVAPDLTSLLKHMTGRVEAGDLVGAIAIAEQILEVCPEHLGAARCQLDCKRKLEQQCVSKLPLDAVPRLAMGPNELRWLTLDHRAAFVLSRVDGQTSIEDLIDISGLPRSDTLTLLCSLLEQNVIDLKR